MNPLLGISQIAACHNDNQVYFKIGVCTDSSQLVSFQFHFVSFGWQLYREMLFRFVNYAGECINQILSLVRCWPAISFCLVQSFSTENKKEKGIQILGCSSARI